MSRQESPSFNPDKILSFLTALETETPGVLKAWNLLRSAERILGVREVATTYLANAGLMDAAMKLVEAGLAQKIKDKDTYGKELISLNEANIKNFDQPIKN